PHHRHNFFCVIDWKRIEVPVPAPMGGGNPSWFHLRKREHGDESARLATIRRIWPSPETFRIPGPVGRNPWKTGAFTQA
ncbi:hypothetical protein EMPG_12506, partial [Blastomyces silverae]